MKSDRIDNDYRYDQAMRFKHYCEDPRRAMKIIDWVLAKDPYEYSFSYLKCSLLIDMQKYREAQKAMKFHSGLKGGKFDVLEFEASIYRDLGLYADALKAVRKAKKAWSKKHNDRESYEFILDDEIGLEMALKNFDKARKLTLYAIKKASRRNRILFKHLLKHVDEKIVPDYIPDKKPAPMYKDYYEKYQQYKKYYYWNKKDGIYYISTGAVVLDVTGTQYMRMSHSELHKRFSKKLRIPLRELNLMGCKKIDKIIDRECGRIFKRNKWM